MIALKVIVHVQDMGDITSSSPSSPSSPSDLIGSIGMRIEGLSISSSIAGLDILYMGHLQDKGDTEWKKNGEYMGSRLQQRRLEGLCVNLEGPASNLYNVKYYVRLNDLSLTPIAQNGEFSGTRGQARSISGVAIWLESKS